MDKIIIDIYNNAISKIFTDKCLQDESFDSYCYAQMIDETHSIVIWGDSESENEKYYVISIREGATDNDLFGTKEIMCDMTPDNSYKSLYYGIKEKIDKYFSVK